MRKLLFLLALFSLVLSGCAYIDQNLRINPQFNIVSDSIGNGRKIAVKAVDDRDEQLIGKRGIQYFAAGKISTNQDLAEVLKNALIDGLRKKGFEPVTENESDLLLKGEIRSLRYSTCMGLWTGGNIGTAVVKIIATQSSGKTYEKTYRSEKQIRTFFTGSQKTNTKVINSALSEAINKVFKDRELMDFLVQ